MKNELDLLIEVCKKLKQANIPYMITGSFALSLYSIPRMTRDVDIVIKMSKSDVKLMLSLFSGCFYIDEQMINEAISHKTMFNIIELESMIKVDFIVKKDSEFREEEFRRKGVINLKDEEIFIVSPEDLVLSKLEWAKESLSEIQINDIKNLLKNVKNIDYDYIEKWVAELGLAEMYERAKH